MTMTDPTPNPLEAEARSLLAQAVEIDGRLMLARLIRSGQSGDEDFLIEPSLAAITSALAQRKQFRGLLGEAVETIDLQIDCVFEGPVKAALRALSAKITAALTNGDRDG